MKRFAPSEFINESLISSLELDMQSYYASTSDYSAVQQPSRHPIEWSHVLTEIKTRLSSSGARVSVLEFGAGRSGFPDFLAQELNASEMSRLTIACQDVTLINESYLKDKFTKVIMGSLLHCTLLPGQFEIVFSNQVFEHVARPKDLLDKIFELLTHDGMLFLFAPRYDFPFYLSPSCRDLGVVKRLQVGIWLMSVRLIGLLRSEPNFVMDLRPACLINLNIRDSDAIHWISKWDLDAYARRRGWRTYNLDISINAPLFSKQWLIDLGCRLSICIRKSDAELPVNY